MYNRVEIPTKQVREIAKEFGYRKRKVSIVATETVTLRGVNWSGGTIREYTPLSLSSGNAAHSVRGKFSRAAPWNNEYEGLEVPLADGLAIVETGFFCGHKSQMTIYVHPSNMPALILNA